MKRKGKALIEKQVEKLVKKKITFKAKEIQMMLQWIKMNGNEHKWVGQVGLENMFTLQWTTP